MRFHLAPISITLIRPNITVWQQRAFGYNRDVVHREDDHLHLFEDYYIAWLYGKEKKYAKCTLQQF